MWDYLFIDNESGEEFFVECDTEDEAWNIIDENFGDSATIELEGRYTVQEAEMLATIPFKGGIKMWYYVILLNVYAPQICAVIDWLIG